MVDDRIKRVDIDYEKYGIYRAKILGYRVLFLNHFQGILLDDIKELRQRNRKPNQLYEWVSVRNDGVWEKLDG